MPIRAPRWAARLGAALAFAAAAAAPRAAAAQQPGLTLERAVTRALEHGNDLQVARARVLGLRGQALAAAGAFDLQVGASVAGARQNALEPGETGLVAADTRTAEYSLQASRLLRSGITLAPSVTVSRVTAAGVTTADASSSVSLDVGVPLLRDRFGRSSSAPEAAARLLAAAGDHDVRAVTAWAAYTAAGAYWDYAAAWARQRVYADAEARAARRVDETQILVRGDERPAADLAAVEAALASARQLRIAAEQEVEEARTQLGLTLGMGLAETAALGEPATAFPAPAPGETGDAELDRLVRLALERRGDLQATSMELRSDDLLLRAARDGMKPRLDLHLSVGYAGRQLAGGYGGLVEPLFRDVPGLNAGVRMEYQLPGARSEARGLAAQGEAARAEKQLDVQELQRQIATGVAVALHGLARSAAVVSETDRAAALYRTTVENERARSRLGASTLFDATYAEDNLTTALLSVVAGRQSYARALAQLRYETGTLTHDVDGTPTVDPALLLTRP